MTKPPTSNSECVNRYKKHFGMTPDEKMFMEKFYEGKRLYCLSLWRNAKCGSDLGARLLQIPELGISMQAHANMIQRVMESSSGVVVLQTCTNIDLLLYSCKALCDAGFVASVAPACLMFHVVTACSVVSFVKSLPGRFSEYRLLHSPTGIIMPSEMLIPCVRQIINTELCQPYMYRSEDADHLKKLEEFLWPKWSNLAATLYKYEPHARHTIEQLLVMDYKMPMGTRLDLKDILASNALVDGRFFKPRLAIYFAMNFHRIASNLLHRDWNPQLSVISLADRLLTLPHVAQVLLSETPFFYTICHSLMAHMRTLERAPDADSFFAAFEVFSDDANGAVAGFQATPGHDMRHENRTGAVVRCIHLLLTSIDASAASFFNVNAAATGSTDDAPAFTDTEVSRVNRDAFLHLLRYLQGMCPEILRTDGGHVEYESPRFRYAMQVSMQLESCMDAYSNLFDHTDVRGLASVLAYLVDLVDRDFSHFCNTAVYHALHPPIGKARKRAVEVKTLEYDSGACPSVCSYTANAVPNSLYSPLHWMLARLVQRGVGLGVWDAVLEIMENDRGGDGVLGLVDACLRSVVFSASVLNGVWVLNGSLLHNQAEQYRHGAMRGCFDYDVFLLQVAGSRADADLFMVTLMDRFGVLPWFSGVHRHSSSASLAASGYASLNDVEKKRAMALDLMQLISALLTTGKQVHFMGTASELEDEVLNHLAAAADGLSYNTLAHMISPRIQFKPSEMDVILSNLAELKISPKSIEESGRFHLKPEKLLLARKHFWHLSPKERQRLALVKDKRQESSATLSVSTTVEFRNLANISGCISFVKMLHIASLNAIDNDSVDELVLENVLHLADVALALEDSESFLELCTGRTFLKPGTRRDRKTFLTVLLEIYAELSSSTLVPLKREMERILSVMSAQSRKAADAISQAIPNAHSTPPVKKKTSLAGKKRQKMLLKSFKKQQTDFSKLNQEALDLDDKDQDAATEGLPLPHGICVFCQGNANSSSPVYGMMAYCRTSASGLSQPNQRASSICSTPCGHLMHMSCFREYTDSLYRERNSRDEGGSGFAMNVGTGEFLCPLCKSLANCLIPALWSSQNVPSTEAYTTRGTAFAKWYSQVNWDQLFSTEDLSDHLVRSRPVECIRMDDGDGHTVSLNLLASTLRKRATEKGSGGDTARSVPSPHDVKDALAAHKRFQFMCENAHRDCVIDASQTAQDAKEDTTVYEPLSVLLNVFSQSVSYMTLLAREEAGPDCGNSLSLVSRQNLDMLRLLAENIVLALDNGDFTGRDTLSECVDPLKRYLSSRPASLAPAFSGDCFTVLASFMLTAGSRDGGADHIAFLVHILYTRVLLEALAPVTTPLHAIEDFDECLDLLCDSSRRNKSLCEWAAAVFLQKCALLMYARFGLPEARVRETRGGGELSRCTALFGLAAPGEVFAPAGVKACPVMRQLVKNWIGAGVVGRACPRLRTLVPLPPRHDELNHAVVCPSCCAVRTAFAVCMVCGVGVHRSCLCTRYEPIAECFAHVKSCSGRTGMLILVESSHVMLLHGDFYCIVQSPYLDRYGELDPNLQSGRPLYMHHMRMREFCRIWNAMQIPWIISQRIEHDEVVHHLRV